MQHLFKNVRIASLGNAYKEIASPTFECLFNAVGSSLFDDLGKIEEDCTERRVASKQLQKEGPTTTSHVNNRLETGEIISADDTRIAHQAQILHGRMKDAC